MQLKHKQPAATQCLYFYGSPLMMEALWSVNADLLRDAEYVKLIKELIKYLNLIYSTYEDKAFLYDFIKCELIGPTMIYTSYIAKQRRHQEQDLIRRLKSLEEKKYKGKDLQSEYNEAKQKLEKINEHYAAVHLIRSKATWIEMAKNVQQIFIQIRK